MIRNWIDAVEMTSFDSSTMLATFQPIDATGLDYACFLIRIVNDSDKDVIISYDGTTDHDYLIAHDTLNLSIQRNSQPGSRVAQMRENSVIYLRGTAGTGNIYLAGYYQ